ncbi:MAG: hypothetical protein HY738_12240 [Bacteroidia bacterium]|nr:hypothetical protein [Bacteroidia bacterium]
MENLEYLTKMDKKAFQILTMDSINQKDETSYWLTKPPIERFIALELLRQRFYEYETSSTRFQRVFSVAQQA